MKQLTRLKKITESAEDKFRVNVRDLLEIIKCKRSFKYFCRKYIKIPEPGDDIALIPNECQQIVIDTFFKHRKLIINKSRQIGISTIFQAIAVYLLIFYKNIVVGVISRDQGEAVEFVVKTRMIIDKLPLFLVPPLIRDKLQSLKFDTNSEMKSGWVNLSKPSNVFRGPAISFLVVDEAAFVSKIKEAFTGMIASMSRAQEICRRKGIPFGTIIVSTPNKTDGVGEWFFKRFQSAMLPDSDYVALNLHWTLIKEYRNNPKWYLDQIKKYDWDWDAIDQEFNCIFLPGSKDSIFDKEVLRMFNTIKKKMIECHDKYKNSKGVLEIYELFDEEKKYIISFDTGQRIGKCYSAVQVTNFETLEQVAEYRGKLSIKDFPDLIMSICELYPTCLIVGEYNTINETVCETIYDSDKWRDHMYVEYILHEKGPRKGRLKETYYGIYTSVATRPQIADDLHKVISSNPSLVRSIRLKFELMGLENKNGRIKGKVTDDLAMAYAFACYLKLNRLYKDINYYQAGFQKQIKSGFELFKKFIDTDNINNVNQQFLPKRIYNRHFSGLNK